MKDETPEPNDIDRMRAQLEERARVERIDRLTANATAAIHGLPDDCAPADMITSLLLASLATADALGVDRQVVVDCLANLAVTVQLTVRVR